MLVINNFIFFIVLTFESRKNNKTRSVFNNINFDDMSISVS